MLMIRPVTIIPPLCSFLRVHCRQLPECGFTLTVKIIKAGL